MKIPIRVLIIEDSEDDKELMLLELRREGYNPDSLCVDTSEALIRALKDHTWDIILSDYSMPDFDGLSALQIVKESGIDIPFIIISGTIGEDLAVMAMKSGAHDYMMKGSLKRLVPAVDRELKEAEERRKRKQSEEELIIKMRQLEQTNDVMVGRELRMIELKKEINELLEQLGEPKRYNPGK